MLHLVASNIYLTKYTFRSVRRTCVTVNAVDSVVFADISWNLGIGSMPEFAKTFCQNEYEIDSMGNVKGGSHIHNLKTGFQLSNVICCFMCFMCSVKSHCYVLLSFYQHRDRGLHGILILIETARSPTYLQRRMIGYISYWVFSAQFITSQLNTVQHTTTPRSSVISIW